MKRGWTMLMAAGAAVLGLGLTGCEKKDASTPGQTKAGETKAGATTPAAGGSVAGGAAAGAAAATGGKKALVIGVIAKSQDNPVFQAARAGAEAAAEDLSKQLGISIKIDWRTPNKEDAQAQAQFIEQLVSAGVDGISISATDAKVVLDKVNAAVESGVAVATFDSDVPGSKRFVYYGVDDVEAGRAVMKELAREMGGKGTVAVLAGNQNATNLQARVKGVREEAASYKDIQILDVFYHAETAADAVAKMQQVQTANPGITGWALVGGWPLYTDNALAGIAGKAKVVSMDPLPLPLKYLEKGEVQVLVGQPYFGWGYETVKLIVDKVHGKKNPASERVTATPAIVTKANMAELAGQWDSWMGGKK